MTESNRAPAPQPRPHRAPGAVLQTLGRTAPTAPPPLQRGAVGDGRGQQPGTINEKNEPRPMGAVQPWLAERIAANLRAAHHDTCPRCGATVLAGLDDDVAAFTVRTDPEPIGLLDELTAVLAGRASFDVIHGGLNHRDPFRACHDDQWPIHLEHVCPPKAEIEGALF